MRDIVIGQTRISSVIEHEGPLQTVQGMFPDATPERIARALALLPGFTVDASTQMLMMTFQSFIVRTPNCTALIDTCVGEQPDPPPSLAYDKTPWLNDLHALGLTVEDIDYVFCTHLHIDHVGWNTRRVDGRYVPTFPNARYLFSRRDYDHWKVHQARAVGASFGACVTPVVDAGQADLVDDSFVLSDELSLLPSGGHSPGHVCVCLRSQGQQALFTGDMMHHAIQCIEPDWSTALCHDPQAAAATRRSYFARYADTDTLFVPTHFPTPTAGQVRSHGSAWRFEFLDPA